MSFSHTPDTYALLVAGVLVAIFVAPRLGARPWVALLLTVAPPLGVILTQTFC